MLELDLSRNDLPDTPLGAALGTTLVSTGLPAYIRVTPSALAARATFASVPARRMRAAAALTNWAVAHIQSCGRTERTSGQGVQPEPAVQGASGGDQIAPPASRATQNATSAVGVFVDEGVPFMREALTSEVRRLDAAHEEALCTTLTARPP